MILRVGSLDLQGISAIKEDLVEARRYKVIQ